MNARKALIVVAVIVSLFAATPSYANISNTSVLFLRIAPGARAAGMGEAFVAIADDATATHWNPAGLGTYPIASTWVEASLPAAYRPVKSLVALKAASGGERYLGYDIWAIGAKGIIRYDNKRWYTAELFRTRTDQTVQGLVTKYFNLSDQARTDTVVARVARLNSAMSYDTLAAYVQAVQAAVPQGYKDTAALRTACDSLLALYPQCRISWDRIAEGRHVWADGAKGGTISPRDMDRIFFSLEHARNRFIPEELQIPYSAILEGEPTTLASNGDVLFVGTTSGLALYNGRSWRTFTEADGLPSGYITALAALPGSAVIGTSRGAAMYDGAGIAKFKDTVGLPADTVVALAARRAGDFYAVVHNDLFHWDGIRWSNNMGYTVAVDDTPETIATKFAIYGSAAERKTYLEKLLQIPQAEPVSKDTTKIIDSTVATSPFVPGNNIVVPYLAGFRGRVTSLSLIGDAIWVGTEYGVLYFDKNRWHTPGYRDAKVADGQTLASFTAERRGVPVDTQAYGQILRTINDLSSDTLVVGQVLKVRANPAASWVNSISFHDEAVVVATSEGLLEYRDNQWARADIHGLGNTPTRTVFANQEELWLGTADRVVISARGRSEATVMHTKWLPELASDLYYDFAGIAPAHLKGLGTIGGNITFISYGTFLRTGEQNPNIIGTFESFDLAATVSFGTSLSNKLKAGISTKVIYSRLSDQGAGQEQGKGTATGFALDFGFLYQKSSRTTFGLAVTNLGPKMTYIDAAQADPLPSNLAIGIAYKLKQADYLRILVTAEANKLLPGTNSSFSQELKEVILNGGLEVVYANLIAGRVGYIYDQEGKIKTLTLGAGLSLLKRFRFDFAYIPSNSSVALANTLRSSISVWW